MGRIRFTVHYLLPPSPTRGLRRPTLLDAGHREKPCRVASTQLHPAAASPLAVCRAAEATQVTLMELRSSYRALRNTGLWHIYEQSSNFMEKNFLIGL